jgi:hypothetical protein
MLMLTLEDPEPDDDEEEDEEDDAVELGTVPPCCGWVQPVVAV